MTTSYLIWLVLSISNLVYVVTYLFTKNRESSLGRIAIFLLVCLICRLIAESLTQWVEAVDLTSIEVTQILLYRFGNLAPFCLWMFSYKAFVDNSKVRNIHYSVWMLAIGSDFLRAVGAFMAYFVYEDGYNQLEYGLVYVATFAFPQAVMLGFLIVAIYLSLKEFNHDLVIERRYERILFSISAAILLLIMTTQRAIWILEVSLSMPFYFRWELPSYIYPAYTYFVTTFLIFWSIVFENGRHLFYLESSNITSLKIDKLKVINANILRRIESAMKIDKLFLEQNLTVKKLSKRISIPEHKIRSSIHSELEFRNFSQFLNHYRILESTKELVNTEKPISTIGMDVGYSSLSTFYKVFKDINSVTPKEYRAINKTIN